VFVSLGNESHLLGANHVQLVEYDHRAHRLATLAQFSFWVQSKRPKNSEVKVLTGGW